MRNKITVNKQQANEYLMQLGEFMQCEQLMQGTPAEIAKDVEKALNNAISTDGWDMVKYLEKYGECWFEPCAQIVAVLDRVGYEINLSDTHTKTHYKYLKTA